MYKDTCDTNLYADSGASNNMVNEQGILQTKIYYNGYDITLMGNGSTLPITHMGWAIFLIGSKDLQLNIV